MHNAKLYQMVLLFCIVASGKSVLSLRLCDIKSSDRVIGTVTNFFPTVVATLGYSDIKSLLLTAPPYVGRSNIQYSSFILTKTPGSRSDHSLSKRLACRQDWRALLPHHSTPLHRSHRIHHRRHNNFPCSPLPVNDAYGSGGLYGLRCGPCVDLKYAP